MAKYSNIGIKEDVAEITVVKKKRKNEFLYIIRYISEAISLQLTSGAFAAAFMLFVGLNTEKISIVEFATNMGLFAASILVIWAYNWDNSQLGIIRWASVINVLKPASMLLASYLYIKNGNMVFVLLAVLGFVGNTAYSMRNSAEMNAVPMLFGRERYSLIKAKCGYIGGIATLVISLVTMFILSSDKDIGYYRTFFMISTCLMLIYAILSFGFERPSNENTEKPIHIEFKLLLTKKYLIASMPHITRGVGAAALALWPATIMSKLEMTPFLSSLLIPVAIVADIIGSCFYIWISRRLSQGTMTMIGLFSGAFFMFMTPFINTIPFFFICFFIHNLMIGAFTKAMMVAFVLSCEKEELALLSAFHVLYYAIAYCPAVILFGKIMDTYSLPCMIIAGIVYCISGIMMKIFFSKPVEKA